MNIQFHLTNACNLRCAHCYQGGYKPEYISLENFKFILDKTKKFFGSIGQPMYSIALTGGEPMCVPGIMEYIRTSSLCFEKVALLSNGILLTPDFLSELSNVKGFCRIQVSLEGPEKINDMIRGVGTFKKIRKAIGLIKDSGILSSVSCTIAPYNFDKVEALYEDLVSYDSPDYLWFDRCIPFKGIGVLTREQFKYFIESLKRIRERQKLENLPTFPRASRALQWLAKDEAQGIYSCGAGVNHFTIMHNGDVMICRRLNYVVGNLLMENWEDIIVRVVPDLRRIHKLPDECVGCVRATECNGGLKCLSFATTGNFECKDINCYLG